MFDVYFHKSVVGCAEIKKEGLYYKIFCTCTPPQKGKYRINVSDGATVRDLGICVPSGEEFVLTTRIPIKLLQTEKLFFSLIAQGSAGIPVADGASFDRLDELESARLVFSDGQPEIVIDSVPAQRDNGLSQEYPNKSEQR